MSAACGPEGQRERMERLKRHNELMRAESLRVGPPLRELPPADMGRAEDVCRLLAGDMAGEALAALSAAVGLTIARLNPHQQQGVILALVQERTEEEWQMQRAERRLPPCGKGLVR